MKNCTDSGLRHSDKVFVCGKCGQPIDLFVPICRHCGALNDARNDAAQEAHSAACAVEADAARDNAAAIKRKRRRLLAAAIALIALAAAVIFVFLGENIDPRARLIKSFARTSAQLSSVGESLGSNIDFISVLNDTQDAAHTDTLTLSVSFKDAGMLQSLMGAASAKLTLESNVPEKILYLKGECMGISGELCANGDLAGFKIPIALGSKVYAINTRTIGRDAQGSGLAQTTGLDIPEDAAFSFFDGRPSGGAEQGDSAVQTLMADFRGALAKAAASLEVEKAGARPISLYDGTQEKCDVFIATLSSERMLVLIRECLTAISNAQSNGLEMRTQLDTATINAMMDTFSSALTSELPIEILVDSRGLVRSIETTLNLANSQSVSAKLLLNGSGNLFDSVSLSMSSTSDGRVNEIAFASSGNHTGRGGEFSDISTFTLSSGGAAADSFSIQTNYSGGELSVKTIEGGRTALSLSCDIDVSKKDKSIRAVAQNLPFSDIITTDNADLSVVYSRFAGTSDAGKNFFQSPQMIFEMSPETLREAAGKAMSSPLGFLLLGE